MTSPDVSHRSGLIGPQWCSRNTFTNRQGRKGKNQLDRFRSKVDQPTGKLVGFVSDTSARRWFMGERAIKWRRQLAAISAKYRASILVAILTERATLLYSV